MIQYRNDFNDLFENPDKYFLYFITKWEEEHNEELSGLFDEEETEEYETMLSEDTEQAKERYYEVMAIFKKLPNPFTIYRGMQVDFDAFIKSLKKGQYQEGFKGLGIYWTYNKECATPKIDKSKTKGKSKSIIITALIDKGNVDWKKTILANMNIQYGNEEDEITLNEGSFLKIKEIEIIKGYSEFEKVNINISEIPVMARAKLLRLTKGKYKITLDKNIEKFKSLKQEMEENRKRLKDILSKET